MNPARVGDHFSSLYKSQYVKIKRTFAYRTIMTQATRFGTMCEHSTYLP